MISVAELSARLFLKPASIRKLCREHKIPAKKRGQWRISLHLPAGTLVTVPQLAAFQRKSTDTIYSMIKKTKALSAIKVNGRWYIPKEQWSELNARRM
jgi:hypothetical protein